MSSEWITTKLGTLVSINSKSLSVKSNIETIEYIDTSSVTENNFDPPVILKLKDAPSRAKRIVSIGDTIISTVRPSQKHYGYIQSCKKNTIVSTGFAVVTPKKIAPSFLYYFLTQENITNYLNTVAETSTSTFPAFKPDIINEIEITLPKDIREQASIGNFLMQIDNKIRFNNKINQTLESISQTLFKSWFIDFDPVKAKIVAKEQGEDPQLAAMMAISGKSEDEINQMPADKRKQLAETAELFPDEMMDSELGEIPKGWTVKPIDEIANFLNGLALQKYPAKINDPFLPVIKIVQLKKGEVKGAEKASKDIPKDYIIDNGDVVFSWSGSLFSDVWCGGKGALNQHLFKVTSTHYPKWFYYQWIIFHLPEFMRIAADKAVTMGHIKREHLSQAMCIVPDEILIKKADIVFSNLLEKYINKKVESLKLAETRDFLLPKLLSGELSL